MAHWLITGMSRSGKSTLAKKTIIASHRRAGRWVGVLDPVLTTVVGPQQAAALWGADWVTGDAFAFVAAAKKSMRCVWIIDECRWFCGEYKTMRELEWMFFAAGNWGHLCYAMAQRLMMISTNIRSQCDNAIIFRQAREDLEPLALQFGQPCILQCETLPKFHAMLVAPFEAPRIIRGPAP